MQHSLIYRRCIEPAYCAALLKAQKKALLQKSFNSIQFTVDATLKFHHSETRSTSQQPDIVLKLLNGQKPLKPFSRWYLTPLYITTGIFINARFCVLSLRLETVKSKIALRNDVSCVTPTGNRSCKALVVVFISLFITSHHRCRRRVNIRYTAIYNQSNLGLRKNITSSGR